MFSYCVLMGCSVGALFGFGVFLALEWLWRSPR